MSGEAEPTTAIAGKFIVYQCRDCKTWTADPVNHTIVSGGTCVSGYIAKEIPIEIEKTEAQVVEDEKKTKEVASEVAGRLVKQTKK